MRSELPKVLHRLCGRSLVHRTLAAGVGLRPERIFVVIGYGEQQLREELLRLGKLLLFQGIDLVPVVQSEQMGTGHAVQMVLPHLKESASPVIIMPGDCPLITTLPLQELVELQKQSDSQLSFLTAEVADPTGFGRVMRGSDRSVQGIVEHKDCSEAQLKIKEINSSVYSCDLDLLKKSLSTLRNDNAQQEYYLTDIIPYAIQQGQKVSAHIIKDSRLILGANSRSELSALELIRRHEINRQWMDEGVTMEDPTTVYIDEDVQLGQDTYLGAGTRLYGRTKLGRDVVIDGNCLISDSSIGEQTHLKFSCVIHESEVGPSCDIGPFVHLRPGSKLHEKVKIGNFVETKKTELKAGAKANHLSYLGDAVVGERVNIGAGTITCNYDGDSKHLTEIESGTFIGSNTCLVAPVKIGAGAYIAAGSTITEDVPAGALGVARARQVIKEDWAVNRKQK